MLYRDPGLMPTFWMDVIVKCALGGVVISESASCQISSLVLRSPVMARVCARRAADDSSRTALIIRRKVEFMLLTIQLATEQPLDFLRVYACCIRIRHQLLLSWPEGDSQLSKLSCVRMLCELKVTAVSEVSCKRRMGVADIELQGIRQLLLTEIDRDHSRLSHIKSQRP